MTADRMFTTTQMADHVGCDKHNMARRVQYWPIRVHTPRIGSGRLRQWTTRDATIAAAFHDLGVAFDGTAPKGVFPAVASAIRQTPYGATVVTVDVPPVQITIPLRWPDLDDRSSTFTGHLKAVS